MDFNLTEILTVMNKKFSKDSPVFAEFSLTKDEMNKDWILANLGNVAYFFDYEKLQLVLDDNKFDNYYKEETRGQINELLAKHILNQLTAAHDKKWFPEIKVSLGDPNTRDM